jgi:sporulation protein YlmC with PRC-barrel domain
MMAKAKVSENALMTRLSDTTLSFVDEAQDIRSREVLDKNREEIGRVNDLFIDPKGEKVRFLEVASGGFLGMGETKFLIPVDAITSVSKDEVIIDRTRDIVASAPKYSPDLVDTRFLTEVFDHYGYSPYWGKGYVYPPYPFYPPFP